MWGQLKPPRAPRPKSAPKPRALRATEPAEGSRLTAVGDPYHNRDRIGRLHVAGLDQLLDEDGLLPQEPVEAWAQGQGLLGARGRATSEAWLAYAEDRLGRTGPAEDAG